MAQLLSKKNEAWEQVAEAFNAATVNGTRTWQQLKNSYNNIKRKLKKENADEKVEIYKTGGGTPCTPKLSDTKVRLLSLLKPQIEPLANEFDSSADYFGDTTCGVINAEESSSSERGTASNLLPVETTTASVEISMGTPSGSVAGSGRYQAKQVPPKKKGKLADIYSNVQEYTNLKTAKVMDVKKKNEIEMDILALKRKKQEITCNLEECYLEQQKEKQAQEKLRREQEEIKLQQEKIKLQIEEQKLKREKLAVDLMENSTMQKKQL